MRSWRSGNRPIERRCRMSRMNDPKPYRPSETPTKNHHTPNKAIVFVMLALIQTVVIAGTVAGLAFGFLPASFAVVVLIGVAAMWAAYSRWMNTSAHD